MKKTKITSKFNVLVAEMVTLLVGLFKHTDKGGIMYKNWKILKSQYSEKAKEYAEVADWCNKNQKYLISENGDYYEVQPIPEPTPEEKAMFVRSKRDYFLNTYIDPYVTNPLRWADMTQEQQEDITKYRRYLLEVPQSAGFPEIEVKTFEEWSAE